MAKQLLTSLFLLLLATSCQEHGGAVSASTVDPAPPVDDGSPTIEERFAAIFGRPTSRAFHALDPKTREALMRFTVHGPGAVPPGGTIDSNVSGAAQSGGGAAVASGHLAFRGNPVPGYPGLVNVILTNTGSGFVEHFLVQTPDETPSEPTPLLVAFHKANVSHFDIPFNTDLVYLARLHGWYLIAPVGATQKNFGSIQSQINVRAALDWTLAHFPIVDRERIYGIGFSMGGGGCASYAARHLDPDGVQFAAIVNHTGTVSLRHAYANEGVENQATLQFWFGADPIASPFPYQRCSTIDLDPGTLTIGHATDMARNLRAVHSWLADGDPSTYLPDQTNAFAGYMELQDPANELTTVVENLHSWDTLDQFEACLWLAGQALEELDGASTLADEGGDWHHFTIAQDAPGAFTPFTWAVDATLNKLTLSATANLERISVDVDDLGLAYEDDLELVLSSADATGDEVLFLNVPAAPLAVTRDGIPDLTGVYDAVAFTFLVTEVAPSACSWVLEF